MEVLTKTLAKVYQNNNQIINFEDKETLVTKIKIDYFTYYLKKKLKCTLGYNENEKFYYIENEEFSIFVFGTAKEEVIKDFAKMFDSLYKNFVVVSDTELSAGAIKLKIKLIELIDYITL